MNHRLLALLPIPAVLLFAVTCVGRADEPNPERISLWNGSSPQGNGAFQQEDAWITIHRPLRPNGTAIVICPGGGYGVLVSEPEGHGIARWLNRQGITGVVLDYRLPAGRSFVPLLDAQQALRTVRARAADWQLDPKRIGILGFSAGGHLASTAATHFDTGDPQATDPLARISCRPDFAILIYPVITMGDQTHPGSKQNLLGPEPDAKRVEHFSNEKQVTAETPPTFLAHAVNDEPVPPENSRMFLAALRAHNIPARYLELPSGGHGLDGYQGPMWDAWQKQSLEWLREMSYFPREATGIQGRPKPSAAKRPKFRLLITSLATCRVDEVGVRGQHDDGDAPMNPLRGNLRCQTIDSCCTRRPSSALQQPCCCR